MSPWGSHYAHLGAAGARASGRAEARPHAQGSRLDVHTELFVYLGVSRRTYRIVCLCGSPFGAQKIKSICPRCCCFKILENFHYCTYTRDILRGTIHFQGRHLCNFCLAFFLKMGQLQRKKIVPIGSTLKGKNLLPTHGSKFFPFGVDPFSEAWSLL